MRFINLGISVAIGSAVWAYPTLSYAQYNRDFVFTDMGDHLVLRFASAEDGSLDSDQLYEINNAEFSSMIHDRLRADLSVDAEPIDIEWANAMQPRLKHQAEKIAFAFDAIFVECKSASCRLLLEHETRLGIVEHQATMDLVQASIQAFIESDPASFDPVFLVAAYNKDFQIPAIKVYLSRSDANSAHQDFR